MFFFRDIRIANTRTQNTHTHTHSTNAPILLQATIAALSESAEDAKQQGARNTESLSQLDARVSSIVAQHDARVEAVQAALASFKTETEQKVGARGGHGGLLLVVVSCFFFFRTLLLTPRVFFLWPFRSSFSSPSGVSSAKRTRAYALFARKHARTK